jgi:hypothetical protein
MADDCFNEIRGVKKLALYENNNVVFNYPDPDKETEIDLISYSGSYVIIDSVIEQPKWSRTVDFSGNYKQNYFDEFSFFLHGIENDTPEILETLRNNRKGFIAEVITVGNKSYVFQSPVFLNNSNTKQVDSHSWNVTMSPRTPTFLSYLTKLNTLILVGSFIIVEIGKLLGADATTLISAT